MSMKEIDLVQDYLLDENTPTLNPVDGTYVRVMDFLERKKTEINQHIKENYLPRPDYDEAWKKVKSILYGRVDSMWADYVRAILKALGIEK